MNRNAWRTLAAAAGIGLSVLALAQESKIPVKSPSSPTPGSSLATKPAATAPVRVVSKADAEKIEASVKNLSSDNWTERQRAQDILVTFGDDAVPRLQQLAVKGEDEEVRTRAASTLRQIEENAQTGASVVTLKMKDAHAKDVFAALARQARCEFPTFPPDLWQPNVRNPDRTITVDFDRVNFWVAFQEVCKKSGVYPQQIGTDRRMTLQQGATSYWNGPSVTTGPFLIVANRISRSNSVDLANPLNVQHDFSMSLSAFSEPKVRVVQSSYNVSVEEAIDDKGNSLISKDRNDDTMSSGQQWRWNLSARLQYPKDNPGSQITNFKGRATFTVLTKSETLHVPDILAVKNKTFKIANRRILIKECKKSSERFDLQLVVYRDGMTQRDWQTLQFGSFPVCLQDKEGKALSLQGGSSGGSESEINYNWNFSKQSLGGEHTKPGDPYRVVWEIPLETKDITVEFHFTDLPLP